MQFWVVFALSLFWGCTVDGAKPGCCMPNKFEAVEIITVASSGRDDSGNRLHLGHDGPTYQTMVFNVSVDGTRKMVSVNGTVYSGGQQTQMHVIQDFGNTKKQYVITGDKCSVMNLPQNWTAPCVPETATEVFAGYFGIKPKFSTQTYMIQAPIGLHQFGMKAEADHLEAYLTVSTDCTVVGESIRYRKGEVGTLVNVALYNATVGIKDPHVFDIPSICQAMQDGLPIYKRKTFVTP